MTCDTADPEAGEDDAAPALATCYLTVRQGNFDFRATEETDTQGAAEVDIEVWGGTQHSEASLYLHGSGDLPAGGEYRAGFKLNYLQAVRLRDRLDDALAQFGEGD